MHQAWVCTQAGSSLVCTTLRLPGMAKVPTTAARWLCRMMPDLTWWCAVIILCTCTQDSVLSASVLWRDLACLWSWFSKLLVGETF